MKDKGERMKRDDLCKIVIPFIISREQVGTSTMSEIISSFRLHPSSFTFILSPLSFILFPLAFRLS